MAKFIVINHKQAGNITQAFSDKKKLDVKLAQRSDEDAPLTKSDYDSLQEENKGINSHIEKKLSNLLVFGSISAVLENNKELVKYRNYIYEIFSRHKLKTCFIDDLNVLILKVEETRAMPKSEKTLTGKKRIVTWEDKDES